jgi:bacillithiol biosynthesis cysteine-adding enzyme BshC
LAPLAIPCSPFPIPCGSNTYPDGEAPLTLRIEISPLRGNRLADDYQSGLPGAARFFSGHPRDLESFRQKLAEVQGRFGRRERETAAAAVRPTSARTAERLARFVEEGGAMVTTGQQTGLFTGPMYTIHKILTAIRLAEALERELGTVVLPVFWCASEDHDFAEVNHAYGVDGAGKLRRSSVAATDRRPLTMSEMRLGEDVESVVDEWRELLAQQGSNAVDLRDVLDPYTPGETVGGAFRGTIERLFAGFDLLVTDAADAALKQASVHILQQDVTDAAAHQRLLRERTVEMEAAGYPGQVTLVEDAANVFYHGPAGRERLARVGDGWVAKDARERFTVEEVTARMAAEPTSFSPNVFLRPVVESAVFPTLAYVGGPAEVAYFAQIAPLFDAYGIRPPVAYPRFSVRLVPEVADKAASALGVADDELRMPEHELLARMARKRLAPEVHESLAALRTTLVERFGAVMDAAEGIDPNLEGAIGARRNRALLAVAEAERKILSHAKKRDRGLTHDLPLVRNYLMPLGAPQERTLNVMPFLAMQPTLLHDVAAAMEIRFGAADGAVHAPAPGPST